MWVFYLFRGVRAAYGNQPSTKTSTRTSNSDEICGLAKPTADDSFSFVKTLITFIAIAAVSVTGAGFYYVSSNSAKAESECSASKEECDEKATCDEGVKPDCGADCMDQKMTEDQNPT
tara:strand:- start:1465 stop:1818 length:354 start_codon:yes stop_codon:yes gene_type:complete